MSKPPRRKAGGHCHEAGGLTQAHIPHWVPQTLRVPIQVVKHGAGPSFEIIFLDITSRGKGWAHAGVTLTVDPPGLAWAVTRSGIPEGPCFPLLLALAPRKPAEMRSVLRQGVLSQRKETLTFQAGDGVHREE